MLAVKPCISVEGTIQEVKAKDYSTRLAYLYLNTNDKGVFLLCKQKLHCFGTALSLSASQMAHEFEQDAT